ncbi:MAG: DUF1080 domain-containing protein [Puniceicoccaceae bacterium]
MMKKLIPALLLCLLTVGLYSQKVEKGFVSLFDGKSLNGWKISTENPDSWNIEDGSIVTRGPRSHLFYDGKHGPFKNFELKVDVWTEPNSNGGIFFHTDYQESGWPTGGIECQVNVSHKDWKKTGSLYSIASLGLVPVQDKRWWTQHIIVKGKTVQVFLNGLLVVEYQEPVGAKPSERAEKVLSSGTIALQCHDPISVVKYKNIRIKKLPD